MSSEKDDQPNYSRERKPLPRYVAARVSACPQHGDGVHGWLFKVARLLHPYRSNDEIFQILTNAAAGCGREVTVRELENAVRNSEPGRWNPRGAKKLRKGRGGARQPTEPKINEIKRQRVINEKPFTLADFQTISPTPIDPITPSAWYVGQLFPGNLPICVGRSNRAFETNHVKSLAGKLSEFTLIVPSAMTSIWGTTKDGKRSMHTLSNTGERMYLVVEFDNGSPDEHASILHHLGDFAPLVMVLWSGGKSTHGWFNCEGASEEQQRKFFSYAVSLGADPRMWTRCQFARLPQGWRPEKKALQQVHYFNPQNTWKEAMP